MEAYNPDFVPNTSDDERRYKEDIGNQASVGMFNLDKLLQALSPLLDLRQKQLVLLTLQGSDLLSKHMIIHEVLAEVIEFLQRGEAGDRFLLVTFPLSPPSLAR